MPATFLPGLSWKNCAFAPKAPAGNGKADRLKAAVFFSVIPYFRMSKKFSIEGEKLTLRHGASRRMHRASRVIAAIRTAGALYIKQRVAAG
jgi:hypothetical protein